MNWRVIPYKQMIIFFQENSFANQAKTCIIQLTAILGKYIYSNRNGKRQTHNLKKKKKCRRDCEAPCTANIDPIITGFDIRRIKTSR